MTPEWHWQEGNKYALEGMKVLLLLNGGAAVALMTFLGHLSGNERRVAIYTAGISLLSFGIGALIATLAFVTAYLAQLHYGNEATGQTGAGAIAHRCHRITYISILLSAVAFSIGLGFAFFAI